MGDLAQSSAGLHGFRVIGDKVGSVIQSVMDFKCWPEALVV